MHLMQQLLQRLPVQVRPGARASSDTLFEQPGGSQSGSAGVEYATAPEPMVTEVVGRVEDLDFSPPQQGGRFAGGPAARTKQLIRKRALIGGAVTLVALALLSGAFWLSVGVMNSLAELKSETATLKRDLAITRERITRIERRVEETVSSRLNAPEVKELFGAGAGSRPPLPPSLQLSAQAVQLLRDYIKVPPPPPGTKPTFSVGAPIGETGLLPIPQQIADKAPELNGARFTTDKDGSIVIVARGSRTVSAIIP